MTALLRLERVLKQYKDKKAVDEVSFEVPKGKIFGLLGPNGAGKTSIIRIITNITRPDGGQVYFDGDILDSSHIARIGYLPEERGLYKKMKVGEQLMYLAQIKGMSRQSAKKSLSSLLTRFDMVDWQSKKIEELSKGMQQKVQFVATIVHDPKLIILDEPFTGLDPINTNLIKDEIYNMVKQGTTVIFSTHRMEQVEEVCENIVLINDGKNILEGSVSQIKETSKENVFRVAFKEATDLKSDGLIESVKQDGSDYFIKLQPQANPDDLLRHLMNQNSSIISFEEVLPTLNEIFIKKVQQSA